METAPVARARVQVPLRGYVIVLSGTVIWALTGIFVKILLTRYGMDPLVIAFWRVSIVALFLLVAIALLRPSELRIAPRDIGVFFFYGLIGVGIHQIVWINSVRYNGASVATVIIYTSPAIVALFAWRFLHEEMGREQLFALVATVVGAALVARVYDPGQVALNLLGLAAGIGSAFTFASYSLLGRVVTRRYSAWTSILYAFLFGTLSLLPISFMSSSLVPAQLPLDGWATVVFLALVPTLGGFASYTIGLSHLPASVASILAAFEPVTTAVIAYFVFGEVLDGPQWAGAGLILLGVVMLRPRNRKRAKP